MWHWRGEREGGEGNKGRGGKELVREGGEGEERDGGREEGISRDRGREG